MAADDNTRGGAGMDEELARELRELGDSLSQRWRAVLEKSPQAITIMTRDSRVLYFNHEPQLGVQVVGIRNAEFLAAETRDEYLKVIAQVIDRNTATEFEFRSSMGPVWRQELVPLAASEDEAPRWVVVYATPVESETAELEGALLPYDPLRVAVMTSGLGVWRWEAFEQEILLDGRSCVIHGLDESGRRMRIEDFLGLIHSDDRDKVRRAFGPEGTNSAQEFRNLEYRCVPQEGQAPRWVLCGGNFIGACGPEGGSAVALGSFLDITQRKLVDEQLVQAQKLEAVGQLTAGISHNFNNILSAILPNLHLAARFLQPEGEKFVRNAQLAAERATDLVAELMLVAGRKGGQTRQPMNLFEVCERVVRICRTTFGGWVQLLFEYDEDCPAVLGNEGQLEQVLLNLLLNARDAFEEGSISCPRILIELTYEPGDDALHLLVTDNGPGMDSTTLERIFEPFFTTKGTGTGLGLATAYAIVNEHDGVMSCWSELDMGARFDVSLPIYHGVAVEREAPSKSAHVGGNECILVVDDDALVRRVTVAALREAGYTVFEAKCGSEALAHQDDKENFDLVLMDMVMPELTGDQVLAMMRARDPRQRVLFFTGISDAALSRVQDVGVLRKPAGVNDLLQAVRKAIDDTIVN